MSVVLARHLFSSILFHALATPLLAIWFTASSAQASSATWLATPADANWATASNWDTAAAPGDLLGTNTNPDTATFSAMVTNGFGSTSPVVIDAGRDLKNITFSTAAASAYAIGTTGGIALLLSSGGTIQTVSGVVNVQTVNAPLVLQPATSTTAGTYTFSSNAVSATHVLNFGGAISTGVTTSTQTLTLTGTNNPLFPASGPATRSFNGLHPQSKFLALEVTSDTGFESFIWRMSFCPEPMIRINLKPGEPFTWNTTYKLNQTDDS